jgi:hypothetical protein
MSLEAPAERDARLEPRELRDPQAFRALAHPLRLTLLELMTREGSLTATRAAELTGESTASCSFHLRQLANYGFVEEAPGGRGRERPWRRAYSAARWADIQPDAATAAAAEELSSLLLQRYFGWVERYVRIRDSFPAEWREAAHASDTWLFLTLEEFQQLDRDLRALLARHMDRTLDPERRPEGSLPVLALAFSFPLPPSSPP